LMIAVSRSPPSATSPVAPSCGRRRTARVAHLAHVPPLLPPLPPPPSPLLPCAHYVHTMLLTAISLHQQRPLRLGPSAVWERGPGEQLQAEQRVPDILRRVACRPCMSAMQTRSLGRSKTPTAVHHSLRVVTSCHLVTSSLTLASCGLLSSCHLVAILCQVHAANNSTVPGLMTAWTRISCSMERSVTTMLVDSAGTGSVGPLSTTLTPTLHKLVMRANSHSAAVLAPAVTP
jgi:hypothetical protein